MPAYNTETKGKLMEHASSTDGSAPDGRPWDGRVHSYRPTPDWKQRIAPDLRLHSEVAEELDPVTYEILRNRLWTTNLSHGETLTRISGSPVFASLDFNMCILTEDGETVMNAPYIQYLNSGAPYAVRYILENLSASPGIEPGDMFLANDPWITSTHQMDVLVAAPVFVDGELFAWVSNAGHQYDLGGIQPGGWPQNAVDVYSDPVVLPPFKIIEGGERRWDLEQLYLRQSRMPDFVELDLRAALVGAAYARDEIAAMCEHFGALTVKAAMRRILDQSEKSFRETLARIPDGTWSARRYVDQRLPGDRDTFAIQVNMTKRGDRLIIDNDGTDPQQVGSISFPFVLFAGSTLATLSVSMLYEQMFSVGGAERAIEYRMTPGTLSCADYPSAVAGSIMCGMTLISACQACVSGMLACDPEMAGDAIAAAPEWPLWVVAGSDDEGNYYGQALLEGMGQGSGARPELDGVNTSGPYWSPLSLLLNCESVEQWYPLVYLYRRELEDSGGAGRSRGGVGLSFAITPFRAESMTMVTNTGGLGSSACNSEGLFGGYPLPAGTTRLLKETNLGEVFAAGRVPADIDEVDAAESALIAGKSNGTDIGPGDIVEFTVMGGGGYGDPLRRDPDKVVRDVADGYVSGEAARDCYAVVLDDAGAVDQAATEAARLEVLRERSAWSPVGGGAEDELPKPGPTIGPVHGVINACEGDEQGAILACAQCGHGICRADDDYKQHSLMSAVAVTTLPGAPFDPKLFIDDEIQFVRYCCPNCQTLFTTEVVREKDTALADMRLGPGAQPQAALGVGVATGAGA